ncbi:hypothetical protein COOONC_23838 [Cooperia oncophora]
MEMCAEGKCCAMPPIQPMTLICGVNEQFSACHTPCQPSCDDPTLAPCPPPTCTPGCHCQPGKCLKSLKSCCSHSYAGESTAGGVIQEILFFHPP